MPGRVRLGASKYKNKAAVVGGVRFASQKEATHWIYLRALLGAGKIAALRRQVCYPLVVGGVKIFPRGYYADFVYVDVASGREVVCDAKGYRTEVYRAKRNLMLACHGITILEV